MSRLTVAAVLAAMSIAAVCCAAGDIAPLPEGQYVTVQDGHLHHNGQRLKLWGVNFCHSVKREGPDLELCFDRLAFGGFNGVRLNYSSFMILGHGEREDTFTVPETIMGSGSDIDRLDHSIYLARQRGMFFWFSFNQYRKFLPADYDVLPDDGTREEWEAMIQETSIPYLVYIDGRAERAFQHFAANVLDHHNPYTGKRYADEEAIALYEIFNEDGFVEQTLSKRQEGIVGRKLSERWNQWLKLRYGTDAKVREAWGELKEGEALASGTVEFAPLTGSAAEYPTARGQDVMRFVYDLYTGFTERFIRFVRSQGKPGAGISVVPITPTGRYGEDAAAYYAAASCGDFVSVGNYGFALRPWSVPKTDPFYPWVTRVNAHPVMETPNDVVRVPGKPFLIYETNDYRPNPYTVEFPVRAAINALWNDADGVFWFTWDDSGYLRTLETDEDYAQTRLPMPDKTYPNAGLVLANDEVFLAATKASGEMFRHGEIAPASSPATAVLGRDILLNLQAHALEPVREQLRRIAWKTGLRVVYEPEGETRVPSVPPLDGPALLKTGDSITFDWGQNKGTVRIDAPAVKAQVGFSGSEVAFGDVRVTGINRDYSCVALVARDGKPLDQSRDIRLTMTSRSTNTGTVVDPDKMKAQWSVGLAEAVVKGGGPPVIVDRVSATLSAPWLQDKWYQKIDFARNCYEQGRTGGKLAVTEGEPFFCARITPEPPEPVVRKVLILGNSLTRHGASEALGWPYHCGMAATGEEYDYAHLLYKRICEAQPQFRPELVLSGPTAEAKMRGLDHIYSTDADLVIIQIGDNFRGKANAEEVQEPYAEALAGIRAGGNPRIFCTSTWGNGPLNPFIKAAAESQGATYVDISPLSADPLNRAGSEGHFTHSGVNWHPGNRGMAAIAETVWARVSDVFKVTGP